MNAIARFVQFHLSIMILMTMKIPFIAGGNGFSDDIAIVCMEAVCTHGGGEDVDNDETTLLQFSHDLQIYPIIQPCHVFQLEVCLIKP